MQITQKHKNKMKILVAVARKILVAVWHMLKDEEDFKDFYLEQLRKKKEEEERMETMMKDTSSATA